MNLIFQSVDGTIELLVYLNVFLLLFSYLCLILLLLSFYIDVFHLNLFF